MRSSPSRRPNATPSSTARIRCAAVMGEGQADEGAAGERIRMRAALAAEVGQEQQAVAARRDLAPPARRARRTRRPARAHRGTSAGCPPRTASPTSGASARAPRGRTRGRGPAGRTNGASVVAKTTPDVPSDSATVPGATAPTPTAFAAWSPPPATTGVPARRPVAAAASSVTAPVTSRPLERRRQPGPRDLERVEHLGRPVARGEVEQERSGAVGLVERVLAGQPEAHVVLGEQDVGDAAPDVRLVLPDPEELRRGEAGDGVVAGDARSSRSAPTSDADLVALARRCAGRSRGSPAGATSPAASRRTAPCICPVSPTAPT